MPLTEKYRPQAISDFAGLDKVKRILTRFTGNPQPMSFLFVGPSGTGKTTMALALANQIHAELHHVPSQECNVGNLEAIVNRCHYVPMMGKTVHLVLVDEADQMSPAAQLFLLSKLDSTAAPPNTIWIFTCNEETRLQDRFISRTLRLEFSSYGMSAEATSLLQRVWKAEMGEVSAPNFARLVKDASNNVRGALMALETEILAA